MRNIRCEMKFGWFADNAGTVYLTFFPLIVCAAVGGMMGSVRSM